LNVYGAAQEENKKTFLAELADFCGKNKNPILIGGDFNLISSLLKKTREALIGAPVCSILLLIVMN